jgi:hypothetical protein
VSLLASGHTFFETVSQIVISDVTESGDDLLLNDVSHFHFALCRRARINVTRTDAPNYCGKLVGRVDDGKAEASVREFVGTLEPECPRDVVRQRTEDVRGWQRAPQLRTPFQDRCLELSSDVRFGEDPRPLRFRAPALRVKPPVG